MKEHSKYPFRSARLGNYGHVNLFNNRAQITPGRGTWRLQSINVNVNTGFTSGPEVFFQVTKKTAAEIFPVGITRQTVDAELLANAVSFLNAAGLPVTVSAGYPVEVDVGDMENIVFWSAVGVETIYYVKVGELPVEDPELEGRRG